MGHVCLLVGWLVKFVCSFVNTRPLARSRPSALALPGRQRRTGCTSGQCASVVVHWQPGGGSALQVPF